MWQQKYLSVFIICLTLGGYAAVPSNIHQVPDGYSLEKTVIFSRHGIRSPLIGYDSVLAKSTPKQWPIWTTQSGLLTEKGAKIEKHFGQYLANIFEQQGLLNKNQCPNEQMLIYTNSLPRTIDTGVSFAEGAFPDCQITVHHLAEVGKMDNTFNPIIRDEVDNAFSATALHSINQMLGDGGFAHLNDQFMSNYAILEKILDYPNSPLCLQKQHCQFGEDENTLTFEKEKEPKTTGALRNATGAADSFILQYYEGFTPENVAWGVKLNTDEWKKIAEIKDKYSEVLFASPLIAKQAATPLLTFIQNTFTNYGYQHPLIADAQKAKIVFLVGHDSNITSLLSLLKVKNYQLPNQYEKTPISGKIVFEKWRDTQSKAWMKIYYLYQSTEQLRSGQILDIDNPPYFEILQLTDCPINTAGFCPMEQFEQAVKNVLQ